MKGKKTPKINEINVLISRTGQNVTQKYESYELNARQRFPHFQHCGGCILRKSIQDSVISKSRIVQFSKIFSKFQKHEKFYGCVAVSILNFL